jgi:hypothetical protein
MKVTLLLGRTNSLNGNNNNIVYSASKYPALSVSFNMGWQQSSSGRRYNSTSGHAFFVGGLYRKPIALQVKSRICNYCSSWKKKHPATDDFPEGLPVRQHPCTLNHENGSASSMEPKAGLDMMMHRSVRSQTCFHWKDLHR